MKARLEGEDWNGLDAELKEFAQLTLRDQFAQRLTKLKDDAAHQQAELKTAILTKTAQAQISDLQAMIDRYLDDEHFQCLRRRPRRKASADGRSQGEKAGQEGQGRGPEGGRNRRVPRPIDGKAPARHFGTPPAAWSAQAESISATAWASNSVLAKKRGRL